MITVNQFLSVYPDFSSVEPNIIQHHLDYGQNNFCQSWVEPKKTHGIMLIAAHNLSMLWYQSAEILSSTSGIAAGNPSKSPSSVNDDWSLTTYGRQYLALRNTIFTPPLLSY